MATSAEIGTAAPDFTLAGTSTQGTRDYTLSAERGHPVVLAFYPGDDTPVCTKQLCAYQAGLGSFTDLSATVWGISLQDIASHEKFAAKRGLTFPLLADPTRSVHRAYDVLAPLRGTKRSVFVIDADGVVAWRHVSTIGLSYKGVAEIAEVLEGLPASRP
ncbi:MAG TPA: peroxiredoxin [Mycobacteriales bacterium]|nr:peroxiredoxin [Mycobacteriales bacterium]